MFGAVRRPASPDRSAVRAEAVLLGQLNRCRLSPVPRTVCEAVGLRVVVGYRVSERQAAGAASVLRIVVGDEASADLNVDLAGTDRLDDLGSGHAPQDRPP